MPRAVAQHDETMRWANAKFFLDQQEVAT